MKKNQTIEEFIDDSNSKFEIKYPDRLFEIMPKLLKQVASIYKDSREKQQIAIFSSIVAISAVLPNYKIFYNNEWKYVNLFGFVNGLFGIGKSAMKTAEKILEKISNEKYKEFLIEKEKLLILENEAKEDGRPEKPKRKTLFIPAKTSNSNIHKLLEENDGQGLIFETEAETLTSAMRSPTNGFTDILRNSFDNSALRNSYVTDHSLLVVQCPKLSVLISGTSGQLKKLFISLDDGFMSRFLFYVIKPSKEFKIQNTSHVIQEKLTEMIANKLLKLFKKLNFNTTFNEEVIFHFSESQRLNIEYHFDNILKDVDEVYKQQMNGLVFRYGLIFWKVAMIITMLEESESEDDEVPELLPCSETAIEFAKFFMDEHIKQFLSILEENNLTRNNSKSSDSKDVIDKHTARMNREHEVLSLHDQGLKYRAIQETIGKISLQTISEIINRRLQTQTQTQTKDGQNE